VVDELGFGAMAVEALFALAAGLFEPLAVDAALACCDDETGYPLSEPQPAAPFHQLRRDLVPADVDVEPIWIGARVERCPTLDRDALLEWLGRILDRQCLEPGMRPGWVQLAVGAVALPLTGVVADPGGDMLTVHLGGGVLRLPLERQADGVVRVYAPSVSRLDIVPFELTLSNEAGALRLNLMISWSPWIEPDGAGREQIRAAVDRLTGLGWDVISAGPEGLAP